MIRKYKKTDYEFVLNSLVRTQKNIRMESVPISSKSIRNKRNTCIVFLDKLIRPTNKCYIGENNGQKFGFSCFKPISRYSCFIEFFLLAPDIVLTPAHVKIFKNHINDVKNKHGYKKMFALIANRKDYKRWLNISKRFLNPNSVTLQRKNHYLLEF